MKTVRHVLQLLFILIGLISVAVSLGYAGAFEDYINPVDVQYYAATVPMSFFVIMITVLLVFMLPSSKIAVFAFLIPIIPIIGCLIRGKTKWGYRLLVYPILILSVVTAALQKDADASITASIVYLALAAVIDILP